MTPEYNLNLRSEQWNVVITDKDLLESTIIAYQLRSLFYEKIYKSLKRQYDEGEVAEFEESKHGRAVIEEIFKNRPQYNHLNAFIWRAYVWKFGYFLKEKGRITVIPPPGDLSNDDTQLLTEAEKVQLLADIERLPPASKSAIEKHFFEEKTIAAISKEFCPHTAAPCRPCENVVSQRIRYALSLLRITLARTGYY
jgi:hypothetical protein